MLSVEDVIERLRSIASDLRTLNQYGHAASADAMANELEEELEE